MGLAIFIGIVVIVVLFFSLIKQSSKQNNCNRNGWISNSYKETLHQVTTEDRGTDFERDLVVFLLRSGISPKVLFHDLYVSLPDGTYSQIDLVVVTSEGIIVIEVKDYSGWIYGTGNQKKWTQVLAYGREKHQFYNPILQNTNHINALKKQSFQFSQLPYYSVIVFSNHCELKDLSYIPKNTFITKGNRILEVINHIKENNPKANYSNKYEIVDILQKAVSNGISKETQEQHIENIQDMLGTDRVFD